MQNDERFDNAHRRCRVQNGRVGARAVVECWGESTVTQRVGRNVACVVFGDAILRAPRLVFQSLSPFFPGALCVWANFSPTTRNNLRDSFDHHVRVFRLANSLGRKAMERSIIRPTRISGHPTFYGIGHDNTEERVIRKPCGLHI